MLRATRWPRRFIYYASLREPAVSSNDKLLLRTYLVALLTASLLVLSPAQGQERPIQVEATLFGAGSSGEQLPFWLTANRYGTLDRRDTNLGARLAAVMPYTETEGFDIAFGADLLGRSSNHSTATFHQLYGRLRYGPFELVAGRKEQVFGHIDTTLSIGGTTWSRNASPMPKVSVGTVGFVDVPGLGRWLGVNAYFAHGWFEEDRFVKGVLLHEKFLYVRLFPLDGPFIGYAGLLHHAQWSGDSPDLGPLPSGFDDYLRVVTGQRAIGESAASPVLNGTNALGAYDFGFRVRVGALTGTVYRQFYLEDNPAVFFRNVWDGLWGVGLRLREGPVRGVLWEHVVTTRQGAKFSEGERRGVDNYYNHLNYWSGWTYHGRTLGLPLLFADGERMGVVNNIVVAHHGGLEGEIRDGLAYRLFATYSRNYGANAVFEAPGSTKRVPGRTERRDQYSFLIEVTGPVWSRYDLFATLGLALDQGDVYADNAGVLFALTWRADAQNF